MADLRDRFVAYGTRPDVYDAPTPLECVAIASEVKQLRLEALDVDASFSGAVRSLTTCRRRVEHLEAIADELAEALELAGKEIETAFVSLGFPPEMSATKRAIDAALAKYRT